MMTGMTTSKIAVSLPNEILSRARRAVLRGRAPSMSAYVAAAMEQRAKLDDLDELLAEMLVPTGGPLSEEEKRAADEALLGRRRRGRRK